MKSECTQEEWRTRTKKEAPFVGKKPFSHNIISIALGAIDHDYGIPEANRAIVDFKLEKLGWRKIIVGEQHEKKEN